MSFSVPVKQIVIAKDRARRTFRGLEPLMESIRSHGLIHPIVVSVRPDGNYDLIAGERRFRACLQLLLGSVSCTLREDASDIEKKEIELDENLHRENLSWQEECELIAQIDELKREVHEDWNAKKTADSLGITPSAVSDKIQMAQVLRTRPDLKKRVVEMPMSAAKRAIGQIMESERVERLRVSGQIDPDWTLLQGDAKERLKTLDDQSVDMILTDPPFGNSEIAKQSGMGGRENQSYTSMLKPADNLNAEEFQDLMLLVCEELARIIRPAGHLYMFTTSENLNWTQSTLELAGFDIQQQPLVWDKGRSTTPFRGYEYQSRYELIIFAHRDARKRRLAKPSSVILEFPILHSSKKLHPFEKPPELLNFLLSQSSLPGETVLDPFAGSGAVLSAALTAGRKSVGIEIDPEYCLKIKARMQECQEK